jgi:hypothetical protein
MGTAVPRTVLLKWAKIQQQFLLTLVVDRSCFTGDLWVKKLINLFWHFNRRLWDAQQKKNLGNLF